MDSSSVISRNPSVLAATTPNEYGGALNHNDENSKSNIGGMRKRQTNSIKRK